MGNSTSRPSGPYVPGGGHPPRRDPQYGYGPQQPFGPQQGQRLHYQAYGASSADLANLGGTPYGPAGMPMPMTGWEHNNNPAARFDAKIQEKERLAQQAMTGKHKWEQRRALTLAPSQMMLPQSPSPRYLGPPASPGGFPNRGSPTTSPMMMFSPPPSPRSPSWPPGQGRTYGRSGEGYPQRTLPPVFQQRQQRFHAGPNM
jgi:hypothetical protein